MTDPGWYHAEGDALGTTRYWDGAQWVGEPVPTPGVPGVASGGFSDGTPARDLRLASVGSRIGARLIDILIGVVAVAILFVPVIVGVFDDIDALGANPSDAQIEQLFEDAVNDALTGRVLLLSAIAIVWDAVWIGLFGGTPGKLLLKIRVAAAETLESPPGWGKAVLRSLNRVVGLIPVIGGLISALVGLASLVMLFADDQHRTVMDRVATTLVVNK